MILFSYLSSCIGFKHLNIIIVVLILGEIKPPGVSHVIVLFECECAVLSLIKF